MGSYWTRGLKCTEGLSESVTCEPHGSMHLHLSVEPPEQPLTSDVKVESLRPKLKGKPLSSPPLPHLLEHPVLDVSQQ